MDTTLGRRSNLTAEEAWGLNPPGLWELIEGRFVFVSPAGARHGRVVARVTRALSEFVEARQLGVVLAGDVGFLLRRHPDTVRAPDVAFLTSARLPGSLPAEFLSGPPDLAVEVKSPGDRWNAVDRKAAEFLAAGCIAVWAIDPTDIGDETAKVYEREGSRLLGRADVLTCPTLLGTFALPLVGLWS